MNRNDRLVRRWPAIGAAGIALAVGAGATYLLMQRSRSGEVKPAQTGFTNAASKGSASQSGTEGSSVGTQRSPLPDVVVTLSQEAMKRAGIEVVAAVRGAAESSSVRIPGTVE